MLPPLSPKHVKVFPALNQNKPAAATAVFNFLSSRHNPTILENSLRMTIIDR